MAGQPGFIAYLHQSEPWKAEWAVFSATATEGVRDGAEEWISGPLSKAAFLHFSHLYTNFK